MKNTNMREVLTACTADLCKTINRIDFRDPEQYAWWLSQAYYFVKHSTPMLALSAGLSADNRPYHMRCLEHLSEEKGHDKMLLNDLKLMKRKIEDYPELEGTQAFYQTQYYWIQHKSPMSFLGYIVILEGSAVMTGPQALEAAKSHKAHTFLSLHSEDDPDHLEKAFRMIEDLPPHEQELIVENARLATRLYGVIADQILENCKGQKKSKAA